MKKWPFQDQIIDFEMAFSFINKPVLTFLSLVSLTLRL